MKKREIYNYIINIVAEECEVDASAIESKSKVAEVVDARYMLAKCLLNYGYYPGEVARLMGMTPRAIGYIVATFDDRIKHYPYKRNNYERIKKIVGNISFDTL
jgi:hypothetical protein